MQQILAVILSASAIMVAGQAAAQTTYPEIAPRKGAVMIEPQGVAHFSIAVSDLERCFRGRRVKTAADQAALAVFLFFAAASVVCIDAYAACAADSASPTCTA